MKPLIAAAIAALGLLAAPAAEARDLSQVWTSLNETAPRSIFDEIRDTAPRSIFDEIRDTAPRSATSEGQDLLAGE